MSLVDPNVPLEDLIPPPSAINDAHKVYSIAAACIALGIIAGLFVVVRLCTRVWCRTFGVDDYAAAVALVNHGNAHRTSLLLILIV